jgi:type IV secretory pathway VirB3-like protein
LVLGVVVIILGLAGIAVGVMYVTMSAHALPSFIPGHTVADVTGKRDKRGYASFLIGAVLLVIGIALAVTSRRRRSYGF